MKPSQLKAVIAKRQASGNKRSLYIQGSPGVGKTQIAAQAALENKVGFMVIHAPLLQPEDYGFPLMNRETKTVEFVVSKAKFPIVGSDCPETGILLIDELAQADANAQKILANLIQAREIHGQALKSGWTIVATGNRVTDRAGANRLLSHLNDRVTTMDLEVNLDDWTNWAFENGVRPEVVSFIRFRPEMLNHFEPHAEKNATPRGWAEGVSATLKDAHETSEEFELIKGEVGEGPASEFLAFVKIYRDLPSPESIILDPKKAALPDGKSKLAVTYALIGALAHRTNVDNFARILEYIQRLPEEYGVLYVRDVIKMCKEIQTTKEFIKWATGPGAKLLAK